MKRTTSRVSSSGRSQQQSRPSNAITRSSVNLRYGGGGESNEDSRKRSRSGNSQIERRKTISSYDDVLDNRDVLGLAD